MRTKADSPTKTCNIEGCTRPLRARGKCNTHYQQHHQPNRHPKIEVACSMCGAIALRDKSCLRWANTYCSEICRVLHRTGQAWSTKIPADHMARNAGRSCEWPKKSHQATDTPPRDIRCEWCATPFSTRQPNALCCSAECKGRRKRAERRAREYGATGTYTWAEIVRLWVEFGKACAYCAKPTNLTDIQAEHVTALSRGGANNLTNLLPSCGPCNSDKRDLTLTQWAQDRERRGLQPVKTSWDERDNRYRHLVITGRLEAA